MVFISVKEDLCFYFTHNEEDDSIIINLFHQGYSPSNTKRESEQQESGWPYIWSHRINIQTTFLAFSAVSKSHFY